MTTYVYLLVISVTSFLVITSPTFSISGTADTTSPNSPYAIAALIVVLSFVFTMITSALVGVAVIRDVEHEMAPIIFTTPVKKGSYLFGRFAGSLVTLILLHTGIIFGALAAYSVGKVLQLDITWHSKELLPFNLSAYIQPFLIFSVSNIFVTGSFFFAAGALLRKPMVIYSQGIVLVMLYQVANTFYLRDLDSQNIAALLDPFGVQTFVYMTRYWTPTEQNSLLVPFSGVLLYNRLIWWSIACIVLGITYWRFSFTSRRSFLRVKAKPVIEDEQPITPITQVTTVSKDTSWMKQLFSTTLFHFRGIWTEVPFMAIAGTGLLVLFVNTLRLGNMYGTGSYPTTGTILTMLGSFTLFFLIIMIFYSGEIIWKERQHRISFIVDASPANNALLLSSKFLCLCLVYLTLLTGFFVFGVILQLSNGYYSLDIRAYFGTLFIETFINLALLTVVSILIQVLTGNKFLGFILTVAFVIIIRLLPMFGIDHEMAAYASGTLEGFSQMNGFGPFVTTFAWLKSYWVSLAMILFLLAVTFYRRGNTRREPLTIRSKVIGAFALVMFFCSGAVIYYNTRVLNRFENSRALKAIQARYEKELKRFDDMPQPAIVEIDLDVDLFPAERRFRAKGSYWLRNQSNQAMTYIHVQETSVPDVHIHDLDFGRKANSADERKDLGFHVYEIIPPLLPGDSLRMNFAVEFTQRGFKSKPQNTDVIHNGTIIRSNYFPAIGYDKRHEVSSIEDRQRLGLDKYNTFSDNTPDRIRFSAVVSTDSGQIPVASGQRVRSWTKGDRTYSQYTARFVPQNYSIHSGKYSVAVDKWNDIALEVYYHPEHSFNIQRMLQSMKDGLSYYTKNFGPIATQQLKIVELPRYTTAPECFPGTISFSENAQFVLKIKDPSKDLDVPFYSTAHELAHQWWDIGVIEADSVGKEMLSEGMAQYSALMVMKHAYPVEGIRPFLKYELEAYLKGRSSEKMREAPLQSVRNQQYISHNKSAMVFFAMQDYIGEESLNAAFRSYYDRYAFKANDYPTSVDLVREIKRVTPDSLKYLISDLFEHITLYDNQTTEAAYRQLPSGKYEITMNVTAKKIQDDIKGNEVSVPLHDWIDVGVYGEGSKLIYLKKHKFTREKNTLTIIVNTQPFKVGIDPLNKLVDLHLKDNVIAVGTVVELANSPL